MRPAVNAMEAAALAHSISGVDVSMLNANGDDLALLARALFGLPFAWVAWLSSERERHSWTDVVVIVCGPPFWGDWDCIGIDPLSAHVEWCWAFSSGQALNSATPLIASALLKPSGQAPALLLLSMA